MSTTHPDDAVIASIPTQQPAECKPLLLWPGVIIVMLQWLIGFALPAVFPEFKLYGILGGCLGGGALVALWWLFFSRARWYERIAPLVVMPAAVYATIHLVDPSIRGAGMGLLMPIYSVPFVCLALVVWAVASQRLRSPGPRLATMVAAAVLACAVFTIVRTGGVSGDGSPDLHWRWTPTPEQQLLAGGADESVPPPSAETEAETGAGWPGFRGPGRDGVVHGVRIATDWSKAPPAELWRRRVGPGWSSFAVRGDRFYTQEQRGEDEVVACYSVSTGHEVWRHNDPARFWESNAGAGPRATPTLGKGRVYTCGATGIVNALDAADGSLVWTNNAVSDTGAKIPKWGIAGSPLVVDDVVIAAADGKLVAYDRATGKFRWKGPANGDGYSSPHLATLDAVQQVLLLNGDGALSVAPDSGDRLWEYKWDTNGIVQPAVLADDNVLVGTEAGVRRIAVAHENGKWTTEERWTSAALKPFFNDFVVHEGHAYGFDGNQLACMDLADGKRIWKGGRYGHGQVILLADQGVLLVLSEKGELALVEATPGQFRELAHRPAIEGKTWNHPVLAGDILLVRNDEEMAAFRLPLADH
jgi:outer membrane protein assembly factor BamB